MAVAKRELFKADEILLSGIAKALAHPARVSILKYLAFRDYVMCSEIVENLPLSQSTVSQHLKELKAADLIDCRSVGPKMLYSVNSRMCNMALTHFHYMFNNIRIR